LGTCPHPASPCGLRRTGEGETIVGSEKTHSGLVIEAETIAEFNLLADALAPKVIEANLPDEHQPYTVKVAIFWARIDATGDTPFMPEGREQPAMPEDRMVFEP
jgi:hypothetical protein